MPMSDAGQIRTIQPQPQEENSRGGNHAEPHNLIHPSLETFLNAMHGQAGIQ
jgi:hypothetical protein